MADLEGDRYQRIEKIGEGTYGIVFKCLDKLSSKTVALKRIRLEHQEEGVPSTAVRQICLLKELEHPGVVSLLDILHTESKLSLVFEFVDFDLKKLMEKRGGPLTLQQAKTVMKQLLTAVGYCHANRVIHRDLKPQNVLVSQDLSVKIADFGLARTYSLPLRSYTHEVITLWYRAPEILLGQQRYTTAVDLWSLGCIFFQMLHKKPFFPGDSEIDQLFKIFKLFGTPKDSDWPGVSKLKDYKPTFPKWKCAKLQEVSGLLTPEAASLLQGLCKYDPVRRLTAEQALKHPFFADS